MTKQGFQGDRSNSARDQAVPGLAGLARSTRWTLPRPEAIWARPGRATRTGVVFPEGRDPKAKRVFARSLMSQAALTVGSNRRSKLFGELLKAAVLFAVDGDGGRGRPEGRRQDVAPRSNEEVKEVGGKAQKMAAR